jgi:hypothetical protein
MDAHPGAETLIVMLKKVGGKVWSHGEPQNRVFENWRQRKCQKQETENEEARSNGRKDSLHGGQPVEYTAQPAAAADGRLRGSLVSLTIAGRRRRSSARIVAQRLSVGELTSRRLLVDRSSCLLVLVVGTIALAGLLLGETWSGLDLSETQSGLAATDFVLDGSSGARLIVIIAGRTLIDRLRDFVGDLAPSVDLKDGLLRARGKHQRRASNALVQNNNLQSMLLAESILLLLGSLQPHLIPDLLHLGNETEVRGGGEINVLPYASELVLADPLLPGVERDFVARYVHQASVEVDILADVLEVCEGYVAQAAGLRQEGLADLVAAHLARNAEGVAGLDDFAGEREWAVGRKESGAQLFRGMNGVLVDEIENEAAGVVVDWGNDDLAVVAHVLELAYLGVDLDELIARGVGEMCQLGPVLCGAEEDLAAVRLEVEDVGVAHGGLGRRVAGRRRRALAGCDAHVGELVAGVGTGVAYLE